MTTSNAPARLPGRHGNREPATAIRRVLLADDSRVARSALRQLLENHSLEVVMAGSAEETLTCLQQTPHPDVIFMDHLMPGMSGLEATRVIKGNPQTVHLPLVMCTSRKSPGFTTEALQAGVYRILTKPVSHEGLNALLQELGRDLAAGTLPMPCLSDAEEADPQAPQPATSEVTDNGASDSGWHGFLGNLLDEHHLQLRRAIEDAQRHHAEQMRALRQHIDAAQTLDTDTLQALQADAMQQAQQISRDTAQEVAEQVIERYNAEHRNRWMHTCIAGLTFSLGIFALGIAWLSGAFS